MNQLKHLELRLKNTFIKCMARSLLGVRALSSPQQAVAVEGCIKRLGMKIETVLYVKIMH
jgi:hypothetical protein